MRRLVLFTVVVAAACRPAAAPRPGPAPTPAWRLADSPARLVPAPASLTPTGGAPFTLSATAAIVVDGQGAQAEVARSAELFARVLRPSTGFAIPVLATDTMPAGPRILLSLAADTTGLGAEGYELVTSSDTARIRGTAAGIFFGLQTLRQLFPAAIESHLMLSPMAWSAPAVRVMDRPRFAWRGAMLDVARHFFTVDEVKQYIDMLALYKLNVFHMHLSDDQGWRIEIKSRPRLTALASATEVGGGEGGFYTQDQYADIVRYARERYITVVPEIDMPGHTNAALIAHPELSCSRRPPAPYTGTEVGWSTFCIDNEATYALIDDVVREIAALTPGAYFHMGGDEVEVLTHEQYAAFVERTQTIIARHGKRTIGWEEIAKARLQPTTIAQLWRSDSAGPATAQGVKLVLSPSPRTYIDMKYDARTELGLQWAALIEVRDAYDWDPANYAKGASEADVIGVEGPLWSETIRNLSAAQFLALPRLPALAEVGWTPQTARSWESFRQRIATHGSRWNLLGFNYYRSPQIPW